MLRTVLTKIEVQGCMFVCVCMCVLALTDSFCCKSMCEYLHCFSFFSEYLYQCLIGDVWLVFRPQTGGQGHQVFCWADTPFQ